MADLAEAEMGAGEPRSRWEGLPAMSVRASLCGYSGGWKRCAGSCSGCLFLTTAFWRNRSIRFHNKMSNFDYKTVKVETEVRTDRKKRKKTALWDFRRFGVETERTENKRNFKLYIQYCFSFSNQTLIAYHMSGMLFDSGNLLHKMRKYKRLASVIKSFKWKKKTT